MGVNDDENFPALIQKAMPNTKVKNLGVPGLGTVQSYLQLQKMILENDIPTTVILNYADFHDMRNALTPFYRENLKIGFERSSNEVKLIMKSSRIPYIEKVNDDFVLSYCKWNDLYENWTFRSVFASVNFLQAKSDLSQDESIPKKEITFYLVEEMKKLCEENDIQFIITGITQTNDTQATLKEFAKMGIQILDISVDLSLEKYNNMPYDSHPNRLTHSIWAERVLEVIKDKR
ncbi:MAG: hypothetical protein COB39_00670 [Marinosulfonomonas sp.]|nr:MAG: hypothetical protein COB39_00670 [Marinosulfonomonas sp.]